MQDKLKYILALALFTFTGCTALPDNGLHHTNYEATRHVFLQNVLPPPPVAHSIADQDDLNAILKAQKDRNENQATEAKLDATLDISRFEPALGNEFNQQNLPVTFAFFAKVKQDEDRDIQLAKAHFNRPRPYITSSLIKPIVSHPPNASYPSGHSCFAYVNAILLSQMLPERKDVIYNRADHFAHNRVVAGVHYPTDVEAGKIAASVIVHELMNDRKFMNDFNEARNELRSKLLQP